MLTQLRALPVEAWTSAQRLAVVALRALFLSGRSIRFEEFNGKMLTARRLLARLQQLAGQYSQADMTVAASRHAGLFEWAQAIGSAALSSVGKPALRYRWGCGLTFYKTERMALEPERVEGQLTARSIHDPGGVMAGQVRTRKSSRRDSVPRAGGSGHGPASAHP